MAGGSTRATVRRDGAWSGEGDPGVPAHLGAASPEATAHARSLDTLWALGAPLGAPLGAMRLWHLTHIPKNGIASKLEIRV